MTAIAIGLAVLDAACYALGSRLQHWAMRFAIARRAMSLATIVQLLKHPRWLAGAALIVVGVVAHVVALSLAPLAVIQPLGVLALLISVLLGARLAKVRLSRSAIAATATSAVGVAVFVTLAANAVVPVPAPPNAELNAAAVIAVVMVLLAGLGELTRSRLRCVALAMAAGAAYGLVAALLRITGPRLVGIEPTAAGQPPAALVVAGIVLAALVAAVFVHLAYAAGPAELVVASVTVADPLTAVALGVGLLGEGSAVSGWTAAAALLSAGVAIIGVLALARHLPEFATIFRSAPTARSPGTIGERHDAAHGRE